MITNDMVNSPAHYKMGDMPNHLQDKYPNGMEAIDVIEVFKLNDMGHLQNAAKYILRAGKKDKDKLVEDLKKSVWYIERQIAILISNKDV